MNFYILGIDHQIQVTNGQRTDEEKLKYGELVQTLLSQNDIKLVGEEILNEQKSIAKVIAEAKSIRWAPIEMSTAARLELGIAEEQAYDRYEPVFKGGVPVASVGPRRVQSDYIREEFMVWRTLTEAEDAANVLVLCGLMHVEFLQKLFQRDGHRVTADSLCKRDWYSHPECPEK